MKWIISNHKNAFKEDLIDDYIKRLNRLQLSNVNLVICPAPKNLFYFKNQNFLLGTQDVRNLDDFKDGLVKYSIVGHSYRRKKYNETDEDINNKIKVLIENGICPILCVGEEEEQNVENVLRNQLEIGLKDVKGNVLIAYEPVWAINSGKTPDVDRLNQIISFIRNFILGLGVSCHILYGGSVNENTIFELNRVSGIDGYLIGSGSVDLDKFIKIINIVEGD